MHKADVVQALESTLEQLQVLIMPRAGRSMQTHAALQEDCIAVHVSIPPGVHAAAPS